MEAVIVAAISATISFLVIFLYDDCQPMRAEPASYPVQVFVKDIQCFTKFMISVALFKDIQYFSK